MLSQKLTRITLKMSDFEEYEQLKRERERAMDTSQPPLVASPSSCSRQGGVVVGGRGERRAATTPKSVSLAGGMGIEGRRPVRASTPDSP